MFFNALPAMITPVPSKRAGGGDAAMIRPVVGTNDLNRPCEHNQWKKQTKKRGKLVLRCSVCSAVWKTRPEIHEKCVDFHSGRCDLGDECPHPHIYARRETASLARRKAKLTADDDCESSESNDNTDGDLHTTQADESQDTVSESSKTSQNSSTFENSNATEYSASGAEAYPYMYQYASTAAGPPQPAPPAVIADSSAFWQNQIWVDPTTWTHNPYNTLA
eukprot:gene19491-30040_t